MGYDSAVLPLGTLFLVPLLSRSHFGTSFNLVFLFWGSNPTLRQRTPLTALWQPEAPEMVMMMILMVMMMGLQKTGVLERQLMMMVVVMMMMMMVMMEFENDDGDAGDDDGV